MNSENREKITPVYDVDTGDELEQRYNFDRVESNLEDYMVQVLFDAMKKIVNQPIDSVADQIHWHRHSAFGYFKKVNR